MVGCEVQQQQSVIGIRKRMKLEEHCIVRFFYYVSLSDYSIQIFCFCLSEVRHTYHIVLIITHLFKFTSSVQKHHK
jgi:hypothetical protein